jgi:adenosylcobinamide-GDP ribazoletransferase
MVILFKFLESSAKYIVHERRVFWTSVTYFTGFPVDFIFSDFKPSRQELAECIRYFGIVGLLIGTAAAAVFALAQKLWTPSVAGIFALLFGLVATRALHEDGIADFADALGGSYDREGALQIMKDPRHGTYGVLALWTTMTLKWQFLVSIDQSGLLRVCWSLVFAHVLSRVGTWCLASSSQDARKESGLKNETGTKSGIVLEAIKAHSPGGAPQVVSQGVQARLSVLLLSGLNKTFGLTGVWTHMILIFVLVIPGMLGIFGTVLFQDLLWSMVLGGIFVFSFRLFLRRWIGGYTGDCLGACQQVLEILVLGVFSI